MLSHASVLISILLAILYAFGLVLHQGYLLEMGLEETRFELSLHRTFFQGFVAMADWGVKSFGALLGIAFAFPLMLIWDMLANALSSKVKKLLQKKHESRASERVTPESSDDSLKNPAELSDENGGEEGGAKIEDKQPTKLDKWEILAIKSSYALFIGLGVFFLAVLALYLAESTGKSFARNYKANAGSGLLHLNEIKVRNQAGCLYGHTVVCNSSVCGYWIDSNPLVLATSDIEWVRTLGKGTTETKTLNKSCSLVGASPEAPAT